MRKRFLPVDGVDLEYRPSTYFSASGPPLLATIKGAGRRAAGGYLIEAEEPGNIPDFLTRSALSDVDRRAIGRLHPAFMGGEYLPDRDVNEVEIARITIASTTNDVTCVYARQRGDRIYYRVVDEYSGGTLTDKTTRTSRRPLSLGELEEFFMGAWPLFDVLDGNLEDDPDGIDGMFTFVQAESQFYPDIAALFGYRIRHWAEDRGRKITSGRTPAIDICGTAGTPMFTLELPQEVVDFHSICSAYEQRFGHRAVPGDLLRQYSMDELEAKMEAALASNQPVPGWASMPNSDVVD